jgi:hypothetical protein
MITRTLTILVVISTIWLSACAVQPQPVPQAGAPQTESAAGVDPATATVEIPPTLAPTVEPTPTSLPELSENQLKNSVYQGRIFTEPIPLVDGSYISGTDEYALSVRLLPQIAYGDLDGDGWQDAAVLLAVSGGGTGVFVHLVAMLNQGGQAVQAGEVFIDDRPLINALAIQDGLIHLDAVIHGPEDPMVSPTLEVNMSYRLGGGILHLAELTTQTPSGLTRQITLSSPVWGAQARDEVRVMGEMPIAPFENNLRYRWLSADGSELGIGPFPVTAEEIGGPGVFDQALAAPEVEPGTFLWLELTEVSMKDGAPMAAAVVMVVRLED